MIPTLVNGTSPGTGVHPQCMNAPNGHGESLSVGSRTRHPAENGINRRDASTERPVSVLVAHCIVYHSQWTKYAQSHTARSTALEAYPDQVKRLIKALSALATIRQQPIM